ncbi:unnamed protein product [Fraxinus pennsylvanica]|uniref:Protein phosphatase n=1 Tax=Fraxinus pennsylvanica TaxID=56036 RepID=A0AAD2E1K4_9LAMI|nr:unnamed protein product [Fraxinus pennsylvanica]
MKLSSHLQMLQVLLPLVDLEGSGDDELGEENSTSMRGRDLRMRNPRYAHRKTRSMSSRYGCDAELCDIVSQFMNSKVPRFLKQVWWLFHPSREMPCNYFSRLGGTLQQGGRRSISGQDVGVQAQIEVLTGLGKSLLGNSRMTYTVPTETFTNQHVFVQPRMVAAAQANLHTVNRIKNLPVFGAVSSARSFPSLSGPSFHVCGYHVDCHLSEPSQVMVGVNPQKVFMAVCGSRLFLADCSTSNLISRRVQPGVAAYHSFTCSTRSSGNYRKASMSFRSKEQPNNFLIYGYFTHSVVKNPHRKFGFEGFHISVCFSARSAPDMSIDNSVCQEQHSSFAESSKLEIPTGRTLKLNSGSCYLPHPEKEETGGEDAHFICMDEQAIGVADGVGGWADPDVDSGHYARELMSNSVYAIQEERSGSIDPARVLEKAYIRTKFRGSSTACIIALTEQGLHAINLGDSGFMVVRDGCMVFRSLVQQHEFNYPYQLKSGNGGDLPSSGQVSIISVAPGDVIIAGTDGLFDNLYNNDIITVVVQAVRSGLGPQFAAQKIAALAHQRAQDKDRQTPFSAAAQVAGFRYNGGKLDDITVVVSYITNNDKESLGCSS